MLDALLGVVFRKNFFLKMKETVVSQKENMVFCLKRDYGGETKERKDKVTVIVNFSTPQVLKFSRVSATKYNFCLILGGEPNFFIVY